MFSLLNNNQKKKIEHYKNIESKSSIDFHTQFSVHIPFLYHSAVCFVSLQPASVSQIFDRPFMHPYIVWFKGCILLGHNLFNLTMGI